ncbi:MAG: hypothetical protein B1H08_02070 [Candidatus Omnitrophica bacterium 4484_171]|nr:MAG: hypothetical protein B1H08_02070 [Candidatus Omnitrophica bacterium 4484_171]
MNRIITLALVGITIIALALGYNFLKVNMALEKNIERNATLENKLSKTNSQLEEIKKDLGEKNNQISTLKKELDELSYPARIKSALSAAQNTIAQLNGQINSLRKDKDNLEKENISMRARIQSNGREIVRLLKELQKSRKQLAGIASQNKSSIISSSSETSKKATRKSREVASLKKELAALKQQYDKLYYDKNNLERALKKARDNSALKSSSRLWQRKIRKLQDELDNKDEEINRLRARLNMVRKKDEDLQNEISSIKNAQDNLRRLNANLQNKLLKISDVLDKKEAKIKKLETALNYPRRANDEKMDILRGKVALQNQELGRIKTLYNDLKNQLKEVAKIMSQREAELAAKDKDIETLNDSIAYLKLKLSNMDEALQQSKENQRLVIEKLSEVTNLNKALQERLGEVKGLIGESNAQETIINEHSYGTESKKFIYGNRGGEYSLNNTSSAVKNDANNLKKRVEVILQPSQ